MMMGLGKEKAKVKWIRDSYKGGKKYVRGIYRADHPGCCSH
jgi:hypothetical protein